MKQSINRERIARRLFECSAAAFIFAGFSFASHSVSAESGGFLAPPITIPRVTAYDAKDVSDESSSDEVRRIEPLLSTRESLAATLADRLWTNAGDFEASAYCLRGRTASGQMTRPGVLAADPRVLPIGTVVHLEAGQYTGIYTVLDTGGKVKGKRVDIFCASYAEAVRFGRRTVRVKVVVPVKSAGGAGRRTDAASR